MNLSPGPVADQGITKHHWFECGGPLSQHQTNQHDQVGRNYHDSSTTTIPGIHAHTDLPLFADLAALHHRLKAILCTGAMKWAELENSHLIEASRLQCTNRVTRHWLCTISTIAITLVRGEFLATSRHQGNVGLTSVAPNTRRNCPGMAAIPSSLDGETEDSDRGCAER